MIGRARHKQSQPINAATRLCWSCVVAVRLIPLTIFATTQVALGDPVAVDSFDYPAGDVKRASGGLGWNAGPSQGWKLSRQPTQRFVGEGLRYSIGEDTNIGRGSAVVVNGTNDRNNPLRRQLKSVFSGDVLFVRFLLRYDADGIDQAATDDGEFFVLWLDDIDGGDGATHNPSVPNIGVRVRETGPRDRQKNLFMVRIGDRNTAFSSVELEGDHTYLVVGKLSKTRPGFTNNFDRFELWVDPKPSDRGSPLATARGRGVNTVRWLGFSTGKKTESQDRIWIDELVLADSWEDVLGLPHAATPIADKPAPPPMVVEFRKNVYPLLKGRCFGCHSGSDAEGTYRLDVRHEILGETTGHPLAIPGEADSSLMIQRVASADPDQRMPPDEDPLTDDEISTLARWIDQGLKWDEQLLPPPAVESDHWAFQPIERPNIPNPLPTVSAPIHNPIDLFLAAHQRRLGIRPLGEAPRYMLIRRVYYDLTGLPPPPGEVDAFVNDRSPQAYEELVDRLLASPQYGERWGRHWLDIARWAESNGYQHDDFRYHAWRYRDYVVRSFNEDKPYDQFLREQIAGDELSPYADDHLIATGFLAAAQVSGNEMDEAIRRNEILVDIVNTTSSSVLGLTMGCCQCHNHKFDPITARDYYRFQGFFVKGQLGNLVLRHSKVLPLAKGELEGVAHVDGREKQPPVVPLGKEDKEGEKPQTWGFVAPSTSPNQIERLKQKTIRYPLPYRPDELAGARPYLLVRGDVHNRGPQVSAGWPAVFGPMPEDSEIEQRPRTVLARWLTSRSNPLTARVWVNRIWQSHFGRGFVPDASNFGMQTDEPLHRELLDWLAAELMDQGWSTKHIHRLILTSAAFRRSAAGGTSDNSADPENRTYWRWVPRRLEAEAIRDALLAVSGEINLTMGGPSVAAKSYPETRGGSTTPQRRTLYLAQRRSSRDQMQELFDGPDITVHCSRRRVSTVPLQPLFLLNNEFMLDRAGAFAQRVQQQAGNNPARQVQVAFQLAFGRSPDEMELERSVEYFNLVSLHSAADSGQSSIQLIRFCHALFNTNEFLYIE